jgi:alpha-L-fucosidase
MIPSEWASLAKKAGMKYVVFTAKHHDGFSMYDTNYSDYKVTNAPIGKRSSKRIN